MLENPRLDQLFYYAECVRNRYVAPRERDHRDRFALIELPYEPRSLAVAASGRRVAVGTKAGTIHVARLAASGGYSGSWSARQKLRPAKEGRAEELAVRGLAFLHDDTLVAGWGAGRFTVYRPGRGEDYDEDGVTVAGPLEAPEDLEEAPELHRFVQVLPLDGARPEREGRKPRTTGETLVALGLTRGPYVYLLVRGDDGYCTRWFEDASAFERHAFGETPIGRGVGFQHGCSTRWLGGLEGPSSLWLLDDTGRIRRYEIRTPSRSSDGELRRGSPRSETLPRPRRKRPDPRSISVARGGVAVRFGDEVTFLPFRRPGEFRVGPSRKPIWVNVAGMMDMVAVQEFDTEDRAYIAVATEAAGLRWIPWTLENGSGDEGKRARPLTRGERSPAREKVHRAILAIGLARTPERPFLVLGSRDHQLQIAAVHDKRKLDRKLEDLDDLIGEPPEAPRAEFLDSVCDSVYPGAALDVLRRILRRGMEGAYRSSPEDRIFGRLSSRTLDQLFDRLDTDDLHVVLRILKKGRDGKGRDESPLDAESLSRFYVRGCLQVFRRAVRVDENSLPELARRVYEDVEDLRAQPSSESSELWKHLAPFGGVLRKWFIYGYTYNEKRFHLKELADSNRRSGRRLDALFYYTALLRNRADRRWIRDVPPVPEPGIDPAIRALAASPGDGGGGFLVHSHIDGRIQATSLDGSKLRWEITEGARQALQDGAIEEEVWSLTPGQATSFREAYRHGPFARSVLVEELRQGRFLVVFGVRGRRWTEWHELRDRPRLVVLVVHPEGEDRAPEHLTVEAAHVEPMPFEIYALTRLPADAEAADPLRIIVGTGGSRLVGSRNKPRLRETSFAQVEIGGISGLPWKLHVEVLLDREGLDIEPARHWRPTGAFEELPATHYLGHNPTWSVTAFHLGGELFLALGAHSGEIRFFRHAPDGREGRCRDCWEEEGAWTLLTYSPVWHLRSFEVIKDRPFLGYATGEGVVGAVKRIEPRPEGDGPEPEGDGSQPWIHVLHTREATPIAGLDWLVDGSERHLAALSQGGVVALFQMSQEVAALPPQGALPGPPGNRGDRFTLPVPARALGIFNDEEGIPWLVVGSEDGAVHGFDLLARKRASRRRSETYEPAHRTFDDRRPLLPRVMGSDPHPWMRLLPVRSQNLLRFSLWEELEQHLRSELKRDHTRRRPDPPAASSDFPSLLQELGNEVYARRPFSLGPAKILLEQAGRWANNRAKHLWRELSTRNLESYRPLADSYTRILDEVDRLAKRWIGADPALEGRILMHSFAHLVSEHAILFLATEIEQAEEYDALHPVRERLLSELIRRRLRHTKVLVALETLRVLNVAVYRAIQSEGKTELVHRPELEDRPDVIGYFDLVRAVGDLARHQAGRLRPSDPLYSELARFFALSILLIPDGCLAVAQVVSESRLAEHESRVASRILAHLDGFADDLWPETGLDEDRRRGTEYFKAYLWKDIQLSLRREPRDGADGYDPMAVLKEPLPEEGRWYTNQDFRYEQLRVFKIIQRMADLPHLEGTDEDAEEPSLRQQIKGLREPQPRYFRESQKFLLKLLAERARLERELESTSSLGRGSTICRDAERMLRDERHLFEPQRSHYAQVIEEWRSAIERRGREAEQVVELIDGFERHVYRPSADELMSSLLELSLRKSPMLPAGAREAGGRAEEEQHPFHLRTRELVSTLPFVAEVLSRGELLVQNSYLAATLLSLARNWIKQGDAPRTTLEHVLGAGREMARLEGLKLRCEPEAVDRDRSALDAIVPGNRLIWDTVFRELAHNIRRYASDGKDGHLNLGVRLGRRREADGPEVRLLAVGGDRSLARSPGYTSRPGTDLSEELQQLLEESRRSLHESASGSNFGLHFLGKLARYLGGEPHLALCEAANLVSRWNLERGEPGPGRPSEDEPLTFAIHWDPASAGDAR